MHVVSRVLVFCTMAFVLLLGSAQTSQAAWPKDQPIQMIVAYPAGGSTDVAARLAAVYIEKYLGQSLVVVNKVGAAGEIGFTALAEAKPDGYTVGFINTPHVLTIPMQRKTRYTLESFIPVAQIMDDPDAFFVTKDSPFNNVQDVIDYAKKNPGKLTYSSNGIGSDDHIAAEILSLNAGIKLKHIPYDGTATNRTALLGGHTMMGVFNVSEAKEYVDGGQLKILGQMSKERTDLFPNTPTFIEQGQNIVMASTRGIAMPAGTPADIVQKFTEATEKAVNDPEFQAKCAAAIVPLFFLNSKDYLASLQNGQKAFQKLWDTSPWVQQKK